MKILAVVSGEYGNRHVANLSARGPRDWKISTWKAPAAFPLVIDYPEDYLPVGLPTADLILSFAEQRGVAELLPDLARQVGARAVIVPIDNEAWLPRGLARQLREWLVAIDVDCATPKPLCSLTEKDYLVTRRQRQAYISPLIAEFARYFGQPQLQLGIDPDSRTILGGKVVRDAVCGCACYVAAGLVGVSVDEAEEKAGLLHHHFPCLASMGIDADFGDTLMHVSGNLLKDAVGAEVKPFKRIQYIAPGDRSE